MRSDDSTQYFGLIKHRHIELKCRQTFLITHDFNFVGTKTLNFSFNCYWILYFISAEYLILKMLMSVINSLESLLTSFFFFSGNQKVISVRSSHVTHYQTLNQIYQISRWFGSRFCASLFERIIFHVAFFLYPISDINSFMSFLLKQLVLPVLMTNNSKKISSFHLMKWTDCYQSS